VSDRNAGLLKHFTVILVYILYIIHLITSAKVVASGPTLILFFCKVPKESQWGMKRNEICIYRAGGCPNVNTRGCAHVAVGQIVRQRFRTVVYSEKYEREKE